MKNNKYINSVLLAIDSEVYARFKYLDDATLEGGKSGLALYNFFCHRFYNKDFYKDQAEKHIEGSIEVLSKISTSKSFATKFKTDSLSNHIAGFGKTLLFSQYRFSYDYNFINIYESISETLLDLNESNFKNKDFDINSGALSSGYFFLNRYLHEKDKLSKYALYQIIAAIENGAVFNKENEVYWKSPTLGNQTYLGISHGSAMIINFITKLFELEILDESSGNALKLLDNAVTFVINRKRKFDRGYFPTFYPDEGVNETQFSMCYGDLGVLYSLYNASIILKKTSLKEEVCNLLISCTKRKKDLNHTHDGGIIYGASGIACIFDELYKRSNIIDFETAYNYWYNEILSYRNPDIKDFAGFSNRFEKVKHDKSFNLTFGWGIMGIGICLMLGVDSDLPKISELLMIGL